MNNIKEKAKEAERNTHPLFETIRESDGEPVSVYDQDDMISMYEQGANYVLDVLEKFMKHNLVHSSNIKRLIEQLKK